MTFDEFKMIVKSIKTDNFTLNDLGDCLVVDCRIKNNNTWGGIGDKWFIHDDGTLLLIVDSNKPCMSSSIHLRQHLDFTKLLTLVNFLA